MKFIITERQYNLLSKNLINEQGGFTQSEKRSQDAYKLMIDGASGWGSRPDLIVNGVNLLTTAVEFHRMNTLFRDKKTGYNSFDEMINGEFEYGRIERLDNTKQLNLINKKLNQLGVRYNISYSKSFNWPILNVPSFYYNKLSDLPDSPKPLLASAPSIKPANTHISQRCITKWNNNLAKAKNWLNTWISSSKTKEKFINGYKGIKYFEPNELKIIFDNYKNIIDRTPLAFYDEHVKEIDNKVIDDHYKNDVGAYAQYGTQKVYVNCIGDQYSDDQWRYETIIHEIQHLMSYYFPLSPDEQVKNVFTKKNNSSKNQTNTTPKQIQNKNNEFNHDLSWLDEYVKHLDKTQGEDYACEPTEKLSNLYTVRAMFKITPDKSLTKEMFLPYIKNEKMNLNVKMLLACWAKQGYPDFNTFLNDLNSLAKKSNQKNQNLS
jgi:hypothetical protein